MLHLHCRAVKLMILHNPESINITNDYLYNIIHIASLNDHRDIIPIAIEVSDTVHTHVHMYIAQIILRLVIILYCVYRVFTLKSHTLFCISSLMTRTEVRIFILGLHDFHICNRGSTWSL